MIVFDTSINEKYDWGFSRLLLDRPNSDSSLSMVLFRRSFISSLPILVAAKLLFFKASEIEREFPGVTVVKTVLSLPWA